LFSQNCSSQKLFTLCKYLNQKIVHYKIVHSKIVHSKCLLQNCSIPNSLFLLEIWQHSEIPTSQSCDFWINSYNAGVVRSGWARAFLTRNKAKLCKLLIVTLVFEKNAKFSVENGRKLWSWRSCSKVLLSPHGHYLVLFSDGVKNHVGSGFRIDYTANIGQFRFREPILRLLNLQLQRQRCSRLERFFSSDETFIILIMH
jgi:hypothetical protein